MSDEQGSAETPVSEDKMAEEFGQHVNYIRQWLDCAPDFPVLFQVLLLKIIVDRNGQPPTPDEISNAQAWLEGFYKDLSAVMGTLEGHIVMAFPSDKNGPAVRMTEKGMEWMKQNNPDAAERVQPEPPPAEE